MAKQKILEWYEYDEAEQQLEILSSHIGLARHDLLKYEDKLSPISIRAIKNELTRLDMYREDIVEMLNAGEHPEQGGLDLE